jgi:hypothetical protein
MIAETKRSERRIWLPLGIACFVHAGVATSSIAQEKQMTGADLFIDLAQYAGKQVLVADCYFSNAENTGGFLHCKNVTFRVIADGIDPESFRYFLKNCTRLLETKTQCTMPFLVTPTGQKVVNLPVLKDVKIAR